MKKRHQQCRGQSDEFPARKQRFDGACQGRCHHSHHKERQQHEKAIESPLAMHVAIGESTDCSAQDKSQNHKGNRKSIKLEFEDKMVVVVLGGIFHLDPTSQFNWDLSIVPQQHEPQHGNRGGQSG